MVKQYDIANNANGIPYLIEVNSYDLKNDTSVIELFTKHIKLNTLSDERVYMVSLDLYNRILGIIMIGLGDYKGSQIYKRNMALMLLLSGARKFVVVHNHPDGALFLSQDDNTNTILFVGLAKILEVKFEASYVVTRNGYITSEMDEPIYFDEME